MGSILRSLHRGPKGGAQTPLPPPPRDPHLPCYTTVSTQAPISLTSSAFRMAWLPLSAVGLLLFTFLALTQSQGKELLESNTSDSAKGVLMPTKQSPVLKHHTADRSNLRSVLPGPPWFSILWELLKTRTVEKTLEILQW